MTFIFINVLSEDTIIVVVILYKEEQFEDTKGAIRSRKFKRNRQYHYQKKNDKKQTKSIKYYT